MPSFDDEIRLHKPLRTVDVSGAPTGDWKREQRRRWSSRGEGHGVEECLDVRVEPTEGEGLGIEVVDPDSAPTEKEIRGVSLISSYRESFVPTVDLLTVPHKSTLLSMVSATLRSPHSR